MNYDVTYSLRMALEYALPEVNDVQLIYEGVNLTEIPKPFLTVEYLQGGGELVSAGRTSYVDAFNFQVGVFASGISERHRLESKVREVIREPYGHTLYAFDETTGAFEATEENVVFIDNGFTPIANEDNSSETNNFRGYFDVGIEIY
jgi:hypothetical protein